MIITNETRAIVAKGLRDNSMSQSALAEHLCVNRSWMTKFFNGVIKTLSDDHYHGIQDALRVRLGVVSPSTATDLAVTIAAQIEKDSKVEEAFTKILDVMDNDHYYDLPIIPTDHIVNFGQEITRAVHADPKKPGKVGNAAVTFLSATLKKISDESSIKRESFSGK